MKLEVCRRVAVPITGQQLRLLLLRTLRVIRKHDLFSELSLAFVTDREIQTLNGRRRKKNTPTDVLSFDYGEILIAVPTARRQAKEHGVSLTSELALLFVHGLLHIYGFDHTTARERQRMISLEEKIIGRAGLVDRATNKNSKF